MVLAQGRPGGAMVLWDFDGTLASTSGDVWGFLAYAAAKRDRRFPFGFEDDDENLALPMSEYSRASCPRPTPRTSRDSNATFAFTTGRSAPIRARSSIRASNRCSSSSARAASRTAS